MQLQGCRLGNFAPLVASSHRVVALLLLGIFSLNRIFAIVFTSVQVTIFGLFLGLVQDICVTAIVLFGLSLLWLLFGTVELAFRHYWEAALRWAISMGFLNNRTFSYFFPKRHQPVLVTVVAVVFRGFLAILSASLFTAVTAVALGDIGMLILFQERCPTGVIEFVPNYSLRQLTRIVAEQSSSGVAAMALSLLATVFVLYFGVFLLLPSEWSMESEMSSGNESSIRYDTGNFVSLPQISQPFTDFKCLLKFGFICFVLLNLAAVGSLQHSSAGVLRLQNDIGDTLENVFFTNELSIFNSEGQMMFLPSALEHIDGRRKALGGESVGSVSEGNSTERRFALLKVLGIDNSREDFELLESDEKFQRFQFRRLTHKYRGDQTFGVREQTKPPTRPVFRQKSLEEPQNEMFAERRLPHIVHFVMEQVRSDDVEHSVRDFFLMPNVQKIMSRGVYWSRAFSFNYHTTSSYGPLYFGLAPAGRRMNKGKPPEKFVKFSYIAMLHRNLNFSAHFVTDAKDKSKERFGFQTTEILSETDEFDGSFSSAVHRKFEQHVIETKDEIPMYLEVRPEGTHIPWTQGDRVDELPEYAHGLGHLKQASLAQKSMYVTDRFIGQVVQKLRVFSWDKILRPVLIVVSGDHGYSYLKERQTRGDTQFRIPFIIADLTDSKDAGSGVLDPKDWGKRINDTTASNVDIWPTIYDVLGVREFEHVGFGRSLMRQPPNTTYTFSSHLMKDHIVRRWTHSTDVQSDRPQQFNFTKYMFTPRSGGRMRVRVYDLLNDTTESHVTTTTTAESALSGDALQMKTIYDAVSSSFPCP